MARNPLRRSCHWRGLVGVAGILLAHAAGAQLCAGPLPPAGSLGAAGGGKFSLIASQCPGLAAPARVHRAAQLDLYSVSVPLGEADAPAAPVRVMPVMLPAPADPDADLDAQEQPVGPTGQRVIALAPALTAAARINDLDPLLLHAIAHVESRHNAKAVSPAGARGVMQVMPATAQRFGVTDPTRTLLDPKTNMEASAAYLRILMRRFDSDLRLVVAAYNAGEGAVEKYGRQVPPYPETQAYVRNVLAIYSRLTAEFAVDDRGMLVARGGR